MDRKKIIAKTINKLANVLLFREFTNYFKDSIKLPLADQKEAAVLYYPNLGQIDMTSPSFKGDRAEYQIQVDSEGHSLIVNGKDYYKAKAAKDIFKKIEDIETGKEKLK